MKKFYSQSSNKKFIFAILTPILFFSVLLISVINFDPYADVLDKFITSAKAVNGYEVNIKKVSSNIFMQVELQDVQIFKDEMSIVKCSKIKLKNAFGLMFRYFLKLPLNINLELNDVLCNVDKQLLSFDNEELKPKKNFLDKIKKEKKLNLSSLDLKFNNLNIDINYEPVHFFLNDISGLLKIGNNYSIQDIDFIVPQVNIKYNTYSFIVNDLVFNSVNRFSNSLNIKSLAINGLPVSIQINDFSFLFPTEITETSDYRLNIPEIKFEKNGKSYFMKGIKARGFGNKNKLFVEAKNTQGYINNPKITQDKIIEDLFDFKVNKSKGKTKIHFGSNLKVPAQSEDERELKTIINIDFDATDDKYTLDFNVKDFLYFEGNICNLKFVMNNDGYDFLFDVSDENKKTNTTLLKMKYSNKDSVIDSSLLCKGQKISPFSSLLPSFLKAFIQADSILNGSVEMKGILKGKKDSNISVQADIDINPFGPAFYYGNADLLMSLNYKEGELEIDKCNGNWKDFNLTSNGRFKQNFENLSLKLNKDSEKIGVLTYSKENGAIRVYSNHMNPDIFYLFLKIDNEKDFITGSADLTIMKESYPFYLDYDKKSKLFSFKLKTISADVHTENGGKVVIDNFILPSIKGFKNYVLSGELGVSFDKIKGIMFNSTSTMVLTNEDKYFTFNLTADKNEIRSDDISFFDDNITYDGTIVISSLIKGLGLIVPSIAFKLSSAEVIPNTFLFSLVPNDDEIVFYCDIKKMNSMVPFLLNFGKYVDSSIIGSYKDDKILLSGSLDFFSKEFKKTASTQVLFDSKLLTFSDVNINNTYFNIFSPQIVYDMQQEKLQGSLESVLISDRADCDARISTDINLDMQIKNASSLLFSNSELKNVYIDGICNFTNWEINKDFYLKDIMGKINMSNGIMGISSDVLNLSWNFDTNFVDFEISDVWPISLKGKGIIKNDYMDMKFTDMVYPLRLTNCFIYKPVLDFMYGTGHGEVRMVGNLGNPKMYGTVWSDELVIWNMWTCDEEMSIINPIITLTGDDIILPKTKVISVNRKNRRVSECYFSASCTLDENFYSPNWHLEAWVDKRQPISVSIPLEDTNYQVDIESLWGHFYLDGVYMDMAMGGQLKGDNLIYSTPCEFKYCDRVDKTVGRKSKDQIIESEGNIIFKGEIETGKGCAVLYPSKTNPIAIIYAKEGQKLYIDYNKDMEELKIEGKIDVLNGTIFYFQKDFIITDGYVEFKKDNDLLGINAYTPFVTAYARLADYDKNGRPVDIYLSLNNQKIFERVGDEAVVAPLKPHFYSSGNLSEAEIIGIMGGAIASQNATGGSNIGALSTGIIDIVSRFGFIPDFLNMGNPSFVVKKALGLDVFSFNSRILYNIISDVIPDRLSYRRTISPLARYLDGLTLFVGKYILTDIMFQTSVCFLSKSNTSDDNKSLFLFSNDLRVEMEFAIKWNSKFGTISFFSKPFEISILGILDRIGISWSHRLIF